MNNRFVVIHPKVNGYSLYVGRKCLGSWTTEYPMNKEQIEQLRLSALQDLPK